MAFSKNNPYLPSEGLKLIAHCPLCNTQYNPMMAKILEEREDAHLMHVECRKCGSSIVALVLAGGLGVSSVGLITDLTSEDVVKFKNTRDVRSDDVIELHAILEREANILDKL